MDTLDRAAGRANAEYTHAPPTPLHPEYFRIPPLVPRTTPLGSQGPARTYW